MKHRRTFLVMVVVILMLTIMRQHETIMSFKGPGEEYFIPEFPNQTTIGKPADIPRRYLIEESDACTRKGSDVEVVAYVHSAISRVEQRRLTRETWGSSDVLNMVVVFMVGHAKDNYERNILRRESDLYHDIVQGDYGDDYHLLSYKALSSLYWITQNCAHVPWTLHTDDDLLIDVFILQKLLQNFNKKLNRDNIHCQVLKMTKVRRKGRWEVSQKELSRKYYPNYCQGPIWMVRTKEIPKLLQAAALVKFLWVDDAYVTGLLANRAGLKRSSIPIKRFGIKSFKNKDLGKKFAWFHLRGRNLTKLYSDIVNYHSNRT